MEKVYRFRKRPSKKSPTAVIFHVMFASRPGRWLSTGQYTERDAVLWAESHRNNPEGFKKMAPTLREFADGFFDPGRHGWRVRQENKNKIHSDVYYKAHLR